MKAQDDERDLGSDRAGMPRPDSSKTLRPGQEQRRVNVDFPVWMIEMLDREAKRLGVTRQSVIKFWIAEQLETLHSQNTGIKQELSEFRSFR